MFRGGALGVGPALRTGGGALGRGGRSRLGAGPWGRGRLSGLGVGPGRGRALSAEGGALSPRSPHRRPADVDHHSGRPHFPSDRVQPFGPRG